MILASIETDLFILLALVGGVCGTVLFVPLALIGLLARHVRNDYRKQGGAPALAKKVAGGIASRMIRRWIIGRLS
jgi:hypothetical protein